MSDPIDPKFLAARHVLYADYILHCTEKEDIFMPLPIWMATMDVAEKDDPDDTPTQNLMSQMEADRSG